MHHHLVKLLLWTLVVVICVEITTARKSPKPSYPKSSSGLSGGQYNTGSHSYPSYSNNRPYSSSNTNGHSYPASNGLSGGSHYPPSNGLSGSSGSHYPSGNGLSGTGGNSHYSTGQKQTYHNYGAPAHYQPPPKISYTPAGSTHPQYFHPYQGSLPPYVTEYRNKGSRLGPLVTGLALFSLGTAAGAAIGYNSGHGSHTEYKPVHGEVCKLIVQNKGSYESTQFDCKLISNLILAEESKKQAGDPTSVITTVTNTTVINTSNAVDAGNTLNNTNSSSPDASNGNVSSSSTITTTITTTNTTANTKPIEVTSDMKCFVTRHTPVSDMKKELDCTLLQNLERSSFKNGGSPLYSSLIVSLSSILMVFVLY